jgi:hypothetical protein
MGRRRERERLGEGERERGREVTQELGKIFQK